MDAGIFDRKLGTLDVKVYRAAPLDPERAALIAKAFMQWGITLELPEQRPNVIEQRPADATPSPRAADISPSGIPAAS